LSSLLEARDVKKYFAVKRSFRQIFRRAQNHYVKAVDGVSFSVERGKVLVIAGESGSGKTTLARIAMKAIEPDSGTIIFEGHDVTEYSGERLKHFRSRVQMVYQDPYSSLDPRMRILDIVREPLDIHDRASSKSERTDKAIRALQDVRLEPAAEIASRYPHALSGGQRQRVALARALVLRPALIVADEPVSMLDVSVRAEILELMRDLKERFQISFVYITHDLSTARYIGDNIAIMYSGKIVEQGPIDDVLLDPLHPYTQALIDAISEPNPDNLHVEKKIRIKGFSSEGADEGDDDIRGSITDQIAGCQFYNRCLYSMPACKAKDPALLAVKNGHSVSCFLYTQTSTVRPEERTG
jgi:peptide/nickel transport system ATP-binding protein